MKQSIQILEPRSDSDWQAYYDIRWRLLRAPWQQPKGSERDEFELGAFHIMAKNTAEGVLGVGRIHRVAGNEWQIRYMAVVDGYRNKGVGSKLLQTLEEYARIQGAEQIILNSRLGAVNFYTQHGYQIIGDAPTLFGEIIHKKMRKILRILSR